MAAPEKIKLPGEAEIPKPAPTPVQPVQPLPEQSQYSCSDKPDGAYCAEPLKSNKVYYCLNMKNANADDFRNEKGDAPVCSEGSVCVAKEKDSYDTCELKIGTLISENNRQKVYMGASQWGHCAKETEGIIQNINGKEGYDLLCRKDGDAMRFIQCDIDDQKEDASNKLDKVVKEGAITSVNENDYICRCRF